MFENVLPKFLEHYEKVFADKKTAFLYGDKPVVADFLVAGIYVNFILNENIGFGREQWVASVANYPNYVAYGKRLEALLGSYLAERPKASI